MLNLHSSTARSGGDDNLIPMINIIFLLLIFFMVAGQITLSADVVLPASISESELDSSPRLLSLGADGILRLDGEAIEHEMLISALAELELDAGAPLLAHVDASLPASALDPLMAAAESLKITSLTLVTEQAP